MRIARIASLAALAFVMMVSVTHAQNNDNQQMRVFNSTNCSQNFACANTDPADLTQIAGTCASQNMGIQVTFGDAIVDSDGCLSADSQNDNGHSSVVKCCSVPIQGDVCRMHCLLMIK